MARRTGSLESEVHRLMDRCRRDGDCLMVPAKGYGGVNYDGGKRMGAHRATFIVFFGPLMPGELVRHTCDRPGCIEPFHLLRGTYLDNSRDMAERGRSCIGLKQHSATVPPEQVAEAVARYLAGGVSQAALARVYGVGASTIGRWVRAAARKDVPREGVTVGVGSRIATGIKPCGTRAGWFRHRRDGERPCPACREANITYFRAYRAQRKAAA